jgi:protein-S-isoprenylcysteine O-methyltransferase Ste14
MSAGCVTAYTEGLTAQFTLIMLPQGEIDTVANRTGSPDAKNVESHSMTLDSWFYGGALLVAWLSYFAAHSLLASLWVKRRVASRWPEFTRAYRLAFNVSAIVLLLPIVWLSTVQPWPILWQWHGIGHWIADGLKAFALLGFIWSLKYYDLQEFVGLRQWRRHLTAPEDQECLRLSPLHRFVRHPWYFFAMVLIWTQDMDVGKCLSGVMVTLYFTVGSRLEEKKLLVYHGERYRRYMEQVPGLFPSPWKFLRSEEAERLGDV